MLRVLVFEGEKAQDKFDKIWEGFLFGTRGEQSRRQGQAPDGEKNRRRGKITKKLKGISTESKRRIAGDITYRDLIEPAVLELEQQELELLSKTMEETDWVPEQMDLAYEIIDWVSAADKKE
jgi:hypothetical protein